MRIDLTQVRELASRESGLAVVVTYRVNGSAHASVVNAGVLPHPVSGGPVVGFVVRGHAKKLRNLRRDPRATIAFRAGWEWIAVDGRVDLAGPDDPLEGLPPDQLPHLLRSVYAAAVGGSADDWAALDDEMARERHAAALLHPDRVYANAGAFQESSEHFGS